MRLTRILVVAATIFGSAVAACSLDESGTTPASDGSPNDVLPPLDGPADVIAQDVADAFDEDGNGIVPASPGALDAGVPLVLWVRGDTLVDGGDASSSVSAWTDQSSSGNDIVQNNPLQQPTWQAQNASYNNQPTVRFTQTQSLVNNTLTIQQPATIFLVGNAQSNISYFYDSFDAANRLALLTRAATTGFGVSLFSTGGTYAPTYGTGNVAPTSVIISLFNGGSSQLFVSSNSAVGPLAVALGAKSVGFTLGNFYGGTYGLQGDIAECAIFSGALGLGDIQRLNAYAAQRYAITLQ